MSADMTNPNEATNAAYKQRVDGLNAANEIKTDAAEKAEEESGIVSVEQDFEETAVAKAVAAGEAGTAVDEDENDDPEPTMAWTKGEIIDYIVKSDVDDELERADLEVLTKTELLDRFIDNEG